MRRDMFIASVAVFAVFVLAESIACGITTPAQASSATAEFIVTNTVVTSEVERFGVNWDHPNLNQYTRDMGMEPTVLRMRLTASGGGADFILSEGGPRTSVWSTIADGFFEGATVRVYRVTDGAVRRIRVDRCVQYNASAAHGYGLQLAGVGPAVEAGDAVVLAMEPANAPIDRTHERMTWLKVWDTWTVSRGATAWRDTHTRAPLAGGRSSLRINATAPAAIEIFQYRFGSPDVYYLHLDQGKIYRFDLWMRQEGLCRDSAGNTIHPSGRHANCGRVTVGMSNDYSSVRKTFGAVGPTWKRFRYDFIAPAPPRANNPVAKIYVSFTGPGTLWLDNFQLYRADASPSKVLPEYVAALQAFRPGSVRIWSGHTNTQWGVSMDAWVRGEESTPLRWSTNNGRVDEGHLTLPTVLPVLAGLRRTVPWLILSPSFHEEEWLAFVEYLAGPPDTPYGALRVRQGRRAPWTDAFSSILIERGNEQWNSMFFPWNALDAREAGLYGEYFASVMRSSPYWHLIANKIRFVANGWVISGGPRGYGPVHMENFPSADILDLTAYTGGWELGGTVGGDAITEDGFMRTLLYLPMAQKRYVDQHVATREEFRLQRGRQFQLAVYEAGPSYGLPSPGSPFNTVQEIYGKSLANAISTLDCLLYGSLQNFGHQAFFLFQATANWASHSPHGFRPHAAWLALQLRNNYAMGQMTHVSQLTGPLVDIVDLNEQGAGVKLRDVSLVTAYAFKRGRRLSIVFLSRRLNESTPIVARLPFVSAASGMRYSLEGEPRANNIYSDSIRIQSAAVSTPSPELRFTLPPSTAYVYVFTGTQTASDRNTDGNSNNTPHLSATISRALGQTASTTAPYAVFAVLFDRPVHGLDATAVQVTAAGDASSISVLVTEQTPSASSAFRVLVRGLSAPGRVTIALVPEAVRARSTNASLDSVRTLDSGVSFAFPPIRHCVAVHDPLHVRPDAFSAPSLSLSSSSSSSSSPFPNPPFIHGVVSGYGWAKPWAAQNFRAESYEVGYQQSNTSVMAVGSYLSLDDASGSHLVGGRRYETAGRLLDVEGALQRWHDLWRPAARVGLLGTSVWVSALVRRDTAVRTRVMAMLSDDMPWIMSRLKIAAGYFEAASESPVDGTAYWSLAVRPTPSDDLTVVRTTVPIVLGRPALVVLRIDFTIAPTVRLYVNPPTTPPAPPLPSDPAPSTSAPSSPPASPNAIFAAPRNTDLSFNYFGFYGGRDTNMGAVDEIRFGDSFYAVTRTPFVRC